MKYDGITIIFLVASLALVIFLIYAFSYLEYGGQWR